MNLTLGIAVWQLSNQAMLDLTDEEMRKIQGRCLNYKKESIQLKLIQVVVLKI
jgi:hypothetical protein